MSGHAQPFSARSDCLIQPDSCVSDLDRKFSSITALAESIREAANEDCEVNVQGCGVNAFEAVPVISEVLRILEIPFDWDAE